MAKRAHITSRPDVQVGDRAFALCGKDFKVKALWDDIPPDKPICRHCVDNALLAMTEADELITRTRLVSDLLIRRAEVLAEVLTPDNLMLDHIAEAREDFEEERAAKRERKEQKRLAKTTCLCTWESPENFVENENCPIHGHRDEGEIDFGLDESEDTKSE
jgi:hypothetical protein